MYRILQNTSIIAVVCVVLTYDTAFSQIDRTQFTQYMFNQLVYNPAYAGSDQSLEATAVHRSQYLGQSNRLFATQSFSVHLPVYQWNSGIGLHVSNDLIGVQRSTFVMANYAYIMKLKKGQLSFGVNLGIIQSSLDGSKLRAPQGDYTNDFGFTHNDDLLPETFESGLTYDVGAGIYYRNENLFAGIAATHLPVSRITLDLPEGSTSLVYERTFYAMAGYRIRLGKNFSTQPSVMVKSDIIKTQVDLSALFYYKNNIWLGMTLRGYDSRSFDAAGAIVGFQLTKNFILSYSYDISTSFISNSSNGSHEILVGYRLKVKAPSRKGSIIYNPRFL